MAGQQLTWIIVHDFADRPIGAIGFVGNKAAVVASFYDDADGDMDGKVSWGETIAFHISPISLKKRGVVAVAMAARLDMDVLEKDPSFASEAMHLYLNFAKGLIADGIYAVYFNRSIGNLVKSVAGHVAKDAIKQFVIRKGMEKAVRAAYDKGMR